MKFAPGEPLRIGLKTDRAEPTLAVGQLAMSDRLAQLEWSANIIQSQLPIDPLLYPPEPGLHAARGRSFDGLHGFLSDSLPDAWGTLLMKRQLERLGLRIETLTMVDRLALVGTGGRGALIFEPAATPATNVPTIDLDALADQSRAILLGNEAALVETLATLGGASGGARPKVHLNLTPDGRFVVGDDPHSDDHEAWIVKFRALSDPVDIGPVEEAYARMARAAGIAMAPSRLLMGADGYGYFATRRFDRPAPGQRVHMISLAGAIEAPPDSPSIDYDGFLRATMAITRHAGDVEAAFRRMVFNILAHNRDDHSRQHSYLMAPDGAWRLAPAYDLTFSAGPGGEHYMAVEGEGRTPTRDQVRSLGKRHGLRDRTVDRIIDEVRTAVGDWARIAGEAGVAASGPEVVDRLARTEASFFRK